MAHPFEKNYFKKYLHKNCHRWWFSRQADNAKYKNKNGTYDIDAYVDEYTVRVKGILEDPYLSEDNITSRVVEIGGNVGGAVAGAGALWAATIFTGPFAPLVATSALLYGVAGSASVGIGQVAGSMKNRPEDVYFHITGDDSYWKAEQVPCDGIRDIAYKICKWSNEVYRERYIQRRSDNYEFQAQIEQRPPTPY